MSVIVKGMEMPEKCGSCDLFHAESPMHCTVVKGHKTVGAPYGMLRPEWCPLIETDDSDGWIPCSERSPKNNDTKILTYDIRFADGTAIKKVYLACYDEVKKVWRYDDEDGSIIRYPLAWRDLPKPYEPKEDK